MTLPNRRRNYFVDKRLQGLLALMNLTIGGLIVFLIGLEILRSFYVEFGWPLANRPFALPDIIFIAKLAFLAVVGSVCFLLLSSFAGHRIAGPIFKLDKSMKEVAKGNYSLRIQFRKKDFFQDLAANFNEMNEALQHEFNKKSELILQVKKHVNLLPQDNKEVQSLKKLLETD